jgi:hypothetical protein
VAGTRKGILLRLDPAVHDALARWAADDLRSTNAQIEFLLRAALVKAGRMPKDAGRIPRRGRPPRDDTSNTDTEDNTVDSRPDDADPPA